MCSHRYSTYLAAVPQGTHHHADLDEGLEVATGVTLKLPRRSASSLADHTPGGSRSWAIASCSRSGARPFGKGTPSGTPNRIALPIAGGDGPGRELVHDIVEQLGFEPIDAGPISESWRQQPGTPVYGKDFDPDDTLKALGEATPERRSEWSARAA